MLQTTETAEEIVARSGSNLAFALAVLPQEKRYDMRVFYGFCRVIDDIADEHAIPIDDRRHGLDHWRRIVDGSTNLAAGIETEFRDLCDRRQLSGTVLHEIIDGVATDLEPARFETAEDLQKYCYLVASAVGLISIEIFGYQDAETQKYAESLGYALQWTNIMRDVGEDADENRIYLPLAELDEHKLSPGDILSRRVPHDSFVELMSRQAERAHSFYREAMDHLTERDTKAMRSPELMRRIYFGILQKMEADQFRVFDKRYRLPKYQMLAEFLRSKWNLT